MELDQNVLRLIPQVDLLMREPSMEHAAARYGRERVLHAARAQLNSLRAALLEGSTSTVPAAEELCETVCSRLEREEKPSLRRVLNATGVALHTNLGRAPLAEAAVKAVAAAAEGYCNLEYDLERGVRGSRNSLLEPLLCQLCGCEAAMAVNNNAAALLLALSVLSPGKKIPVSRGELVEIGDSFRLPDIMAQSGGILTEVGTTNKTRLRDYEEVLQSGDVGILLKVHTSNYRITGFTESVSVPELEGLARTYGVPLLVDLGSGALLEETDYPFTGEPTVPQTLRDGANLVCFSADKLLGGPQAGILLGDRRLISWMRKSPLARALRIDKLSLAALEATLLLYRDPANARNCIPALRMLNATGGELREKGGRLLALLQNECVSAAFSLLPQKRPVGGGSAPGQELDSYAVGIFPVGMSVAELENRLRHAAVPIVARISDGHLLLDVSTLEEPDFGLVVQQTTQILDGKRS
ncbi:MAG: L-seryl-tRNA(Sec) selenium transferase [Ruminococcaceae bacterium]|nr:L-seryl-tRNA(Sec) selenium transferase [Oscillospiraceae bacterium]